MSKLDHATKGCSLLAKVGRFFNFYVKNAIARKMGTSYKHCHFLYTLIDDILTKLVTKFGSGSCFMVACWRNPTLVLVGNLARQVTHGFQPHNLLWTKLWKE